MAGQMTIGLITRWFKRFFGSKDSGDPDSAFNHIFSRIEYSDVSAVGTYLLFTLPVRAIVTACFFVVLTDWQSEGMATMKIEGSLYDRAIRSNPKGSLSAGAVIRLPLPAAPSEILKWVTSIAPWTAGVGILSVEYMAPPA